MTWALLMATSAAIQHAGPPPPRSLPPYTSVVTALVLKQAVWAPGSLADRVPPFKRDRTYSSVDLEIVSWRPGSAQQDELLRVGQRLEAFCEGRLPKVTGKTETGRLRFLGDTRGTRWELSDPTETRAQDDLEAPPDRVGKCPSW